MKARLRALLGRTRMVAIATGARARKQANTSSALFAGWIMVATGFGLHDLGTGLIVGGALLAVGAIIVAAGEEG